MDWFQAVDIYCERTSPAFWAEPVNAISNASFVIAAVWAAVSARARGVVAWDAWVLIFMAGLIGIGSFLFHTYATVWSGFADTIPIWSFVALFVFVAIYRLGGVRPGKLVGIGLGVAAVTVVLTLAAGDGSAPADAAPVAPTPLNGSEQYAPALLALLIFTGMTQWRRHPLRAWVLAATVTFAVSLGFRTVDTALCPGWPTGTHFVWHLLNGLMIGILLQMLVRAVPPGPAKAI